MKFFTDSTGEVRYVDGPPLNDSSANGGLSFSPLGQVHTTTAIDSFGADGFVSGFRVSGLGMLVVGDGGPAAQPYIYIAGLPTDGSPGRAGVLIRQFGTPPDTDPRVAGVAVGADGVYFAGVGPVCIPVSVVTDPIIVGTGTVGTQITVTSPGTYDGTNPISVTGPVWYADEDSQGGGNSFDVLPAYDGRTITARYDVANPCGNLVAISNGILVTAGAWSPADLYLSGQLGAWLDVSDLSVMFQDVAKTIPAAVGSPVAVIVDKSPNGWDAVQSNVAQQPILQLDGNGNYYLLFDGADDALPLSFPGMTTMNNFYAVDVSTAPQGVMISAGGRSDSNLMTWAPDEPSAPYYNQYTVVDVLVDKVPLTPRTQGQLALDLVTPPTTVYSEIGVGALVDDNWTLFGGYGYGFDPAGKLYGFIVVDSISAGDIVKVNDWLLARMA